MLHKFRVLTRKSINLGKLFYLFAKVWTVVRQSVLEKVIATVEALNKIVIHLFFSLY